MRNKRARQLRKASARVGVRYRRAKRNWQTVPRPERHSLGAHLGVLASVKLDGQRTTVGAQGVQGASNATT